MSTKTRRQKREEARRLFLTGECSTNAEIASRLHMKPHTVGRYRKEEGWDELRVRVDRDAAERMVESLSGERVNLNLRHYRYFEAILAQVGEAMKSDEAKGIRELERLTTIVERVQKGQRLARGLSLTGENEEQIRAQAFAENRALIDTFIDAIKAHVPEEATRDKIRLAILETISAPPADKAEAPA